MIEAIGNPESWELATQLVRKGGTINFFGVTMAGPDMSGMTPRTFSLDVTDKIKALQASGALNETPTVTLVPQGEPAENARASIGQVQLVTQ